MSENLSIFNIADHAKEVNQAMYGGGFESNLFDVRVEEGKTTTFIIRPLPYIKDIVNSKVTKYFYAIPHNGASIIFDSMTTFNRPMVGDYKFCPISDIWKKLSTNADPNVQAIAKEIRRQVGMYQYVQIIACPAKEEWNGKFMPMKIPVEMDKLCRELSEPNADALKLGKVAITAMDLFKGVKLECTITGHRQFGTVMRDWKISADKDPSEIQLPLGANGAMTPVSQLDQAAVLAYFESNQAIDLEGTYGYKAPSQEAEIAAYNWLMHLCSHVPGMREAIDNNFKSVAAMYNSQSLGAMNDPNANIQTQQVAYGGAPQQTFQSGNPMDAMQQTPVQPTVVEPVAPPVQPTVVEPVAPIDNAGTAEAPPVQPTVVEPVAPVIPIIP